MTNLVEALGAAEEAFPDRVTIYVPSRDMDGQDVNNVEWIDGAMGLLAEIGGGATQMPPCKGVWRRDDGVLIREDTTQIYSFVDGDKFVDAIGKVRAFLHAMGKALNQGEIALEVSGRFYKIRKYD